MPKASVRLLKTLFRLSFPALVLATPLALLAQAGQGGGARGGAGAPAAPGGPAAAAPAGQGRGGQAPTPATAGARGAAPVDLTGYWVSLVTEDWIERMSPDSPRSGVVGGRGGGGGGGGRGGAAPQAVPANPTEPCRVYGAAGSLRVPGRLNITWADDNTLKIDMDAGTQTRLLRFNAPTPPAGTEKTLQGYSVATWEVGGGRGGRGGGAAPATRWGNLKVVTTNMKSGYLLSSRSSYSENTILTENFTRHSDFGVDYLTVTAVVEDGAMRVTSSTFKKEPNGSKFSPTGCEVVR